MIAPVQTTYSRRHPSPLYRLLVALYKQWHKESHKHFRGSWRKEAVYKQIKELISETGAGTLLDYGCGKGLHFRNPKMSEKDARLLRELGVRVSGYDPGWRPFAKLPKGPFDGVVALDVLEHIPKDDIPWVLWEIFGYARKFVLVEVALFPSKKHFKDGRNVHVTLEPEEWWMKEMEAASAGHDVVRRCLFYRGKQSEKTETPSPLEDIKKVEVT